MENADVRTGHPSDGGGSSPRHLRGGPTALRSRSAVRALWDYFYELGWRLFTWIFVIGLFVILGLDEASKGKWLLGLASFVVAVGLPTLWSWLFWFRRPD